MPILSKTKNAAGEPSLYEDAIDHSGYSGGAAAADPDQSRNMVLNDGRRNRQASPGAALKTEEAETGGNLDMGTENDMKGLMDGNSRDPGAKKTLDGDDTAMEDRY